MTLRLENPIAPQHLAEHVILTTVDDLSCWAKLASLDLWRSGTACCLVELSTMVGSRVDLERLGCFPRLSPRQADLLITAGTIPMKYAPVLVRLYEQMPEPKSVIAMGACTMTGGRDCADAPSPVRGVDKLIPVDVYLPGCPPFPEAIVDALIKVRKKIDNHRMQARSHVNQAHFSYSRLYAMNPSAQSP